MEGNPVNLTDPFGLSPSLGSKVIHGVLDAAGDIPYIGCIADTANAIYYAAEGKYGEAVISLICAIPEYGDLFDKIKDIRKVGRVGGSTKTDFYVGANGTARSLDEYDAFSNNSYVQSYTHIFSKRV